MSEPRHEDYFSDDMEVDTPEYTEAVRKYTLAINSYQEEILRAEMLVDMLVKAEYIDLDAIRQRLSNQHRTHQQGAARGIRKILEAMTQQWYDERNRGMITFANTALKATEDIGLPLI